jgi:plasmid replication initiation protein
MEVLTLNYDDLDPDSLQGVIVRKHNDLIEAKYQIQNIQEQRVILMLLAQIKPNDEDFKGYRIAVLDFAKIAGIRPDNIYERLEATAQGLLSRTIKIKNGKSFLMANWLSSAEYRHGSGYIELCFDPKLKPYLLQLQDHFTRLEVDKVLHFKSVYSVRLYELLKKEAQIVEKYQNKKHFEKEFSYIELREAFGIEKKEYKLFANFKKKTIEPAVTEIYDKTELNIYEVAYGKTGRAVSRVTFKVEIRSKADGDIRAVQIRIDEQPKEKDKSNKEALIERLVELGYSFESARRDVNKYGIQRIEKGIAYTLAKQQAGEVKNFHAYLSKAIENDWGGAWEQAVIDGKSKVEKQQQAEKEKEALAEKKRQEQKEKYNKILRSFYSLEEETKEEIETEFSAFLQEENKQLLKYYRNAKENDGERWADEPKIRVTFISFLISRGF